MSDESLGKKLIHREPARPGDAHTIDGMIGPGFEQVVKEFTRNFAERGDRGAAFSAYVDGELVVDLWGGTADARRATPWREDTLAGIFSGTKGIVAVCLLLLIERGLLDLEATVASYWPEFGARGKESILVRHLVSHHAGLPGLDTPVTADEATDSVRMAKLLAAQDPVSAPGKSLFYHALTFGWLCGELVRRIDGRSIGRFFREEVAEPLELEAWIGLPAEEERRVAVLERAHGFGNQERDQAAGDRTDALAWSIWGNPPRFSAGVLAANTRRWREAEVPASSGVASARSMARLYGCLARSGEIDAIQLMKPQTIELGTTPLSSGFEPYLRKELAFGIGFALQTSAAQFGPVVHAFGHPGSGGSVHGAWPDIKTGFSYVTNTLQERQGADPRSNSLLIALRAALAAREGAP